jgi:cysteine-S-conjugate beta-lyase
MTKDVPVADSTRLIHTAAEESARLPAKTVGPAIQRGSTVLMDRAADLYAHGKITYGRDGLAAHHALIAGLKDLEHAEHVELYGSGLGAVTGAMLSVLKAGDEVLVVDGAYKPTRRFCDNFLKNYGVSVRYFPSDARPDEVLALITERTRLIALESPASLSFEMMDVGAVAAGARERGVLTLMDNTWAAGLYFRPLDHGIDLSVQALTKYVGGHADVFLGSAATRNPVVARKLAQTTLNLGHSVGPEEAYLALRGLRTLPARLAAHGANGLKVAKWLMGRTEVARVRHPALPHDPGHALWKRDFSGCCGLFAFELAPPAGLAETLAFLDALKLFGLGFSLGGYESLALYCDPQVKEARTAKPWTAAGPLIRLHVGLEDPADLIADLEAGFAAIKP